VILLLAHHGELSAELQRRAMQQPTAELRDEGAGQSELPARALERVAERRTG